MRSRTASDEPRPSGGLHPMVTEVYDDLKAIAQRQLGRERAGHTLQPTALVHEAYLRLASQSTDRWREREHLIAIAVEVIRRVLVDHARRRATQRRGGHVERVELPEEPSIVDECTVDLLALDEALHALARLSERQSRVAQLRLFGGLSPAEVARVLDVSESTVYAEWRLARAWLSRELSEKRDA